MTTQRQAALKGIITPQMKAVARDEGRQETEIRDGLAKGTIAIPFNPRHRGLKAIGIGKGLRTKVNANIGTSADFPQLKNELVKLKAAIDAKTDALMDLSTGGNINATRKAIMSACPVPVAVLKAIEVAVEAALPKEVSIRFENELES